MRHLRRIVTNVNLPNWSERQRRFLDAYRQSPNIAPAARLAGVHRATVYRCKEHAAFADALRASYEVFYRENRLKVTAEAAARKRWREERERARRPMRCHYLWRTELWSRSFPNSGCKNLAA